MKNTLPFNRVIILVDRFDSLGGIQRWANQIAGEFHVRGYEVYLIGFTRPPLNMLVEYPRDPEINAITLLDSDSHLARKGLIGTVRKIVTELPLGLNRAVETILSGWRPRTVDKSAVAKLKAELEDIREGTVIIATSQFFLNHLKATNIPIGKGFKTPLIGQYHSDFGLITTRKRAIKGFKESYNDADRVVFLTEEDKQLAAQFDIMNTESIPNPKPAVPQDVGSPKKGKVAVALGRLERQKSFEYTILAWKEIKNQYPDWQLHIYGEGPQRKRLEGLIRKYNLSEVVFLKGLTDQPLQVLAEASIHLLSSQHEGWPLTISEAASVATPTIAFDAGAGIRAQISSGENGILVEKNNTKDYVAALESVLSDSQFLTQMGQKAKENSACFEVRHIAEIWQGLFWDLVR